MAEIAQAVLADGLRLQAKEALALINSNAFGLGWACLALVRAHRAVEVLEEAAALTYEGLLANPAALDPEVARARPHAGLAIALSRLRDLLAGGTLLQGGLVRNLQEPLSVRGVAQVSGAAREALGARDGPGRDGAPVLGRQPAADPRRVPRDLVRELRRGRRGGGARLRPHRLRAGDHDLGRARAEARLARPQRSARRSARAPTTTPATASTSCPTAPRPPPRRRACSRSRPRSSSRRRASPRASRTASRCSRSARGGWMRWPRWRCAWPPSSCSARRRPSTCAGADPSWGTVPVSTYDLTRTHIAFTGPDDGAPTGLDELCAALAQG